MGAAEPIRVGVLAVHGMGEQERGEFVDRLAADLKQAIAAEFPSARVQRSRIVDPVPPILAIRIGRLGPAEAPDRDLEVYLHEAFWADLDDRSTFWGRVKFWWWGFSMWARNGLHVPLLPGTKAHMALDRRPGRQILWVRAKLFLAANLFCAVGLVLRALTQFAFILPVVGPYLKRGIDWWFRGQPPIETIVAYMGDVKLYQDEAPATEPVERRGQRSRVAIRRRVVRQMISVATAGYDHWYVLAHSLGSIVAFNALMETASALPNYLDEPTYRLLRRHGWLKVVPGSEPGEMSPPRPCYAEHDVCLDRPSLFQGLRGFLTYGSPIDKFTVLWPHVAGTNVEPEVFRPDFEWVNVYDRVDPVAGFIDLVGDLSSLRQAGEGQPDLPQNWGYARQRTIATGHTHYFARPAAPASIARAVARWLLEPGRHFPAAQSEPISGSDRRQARQGWLWLQFVLTYLVLAAAGGALIDLVAGWLGVADFRFLTDCPWTVIVFMVGCCLIVAATGGIHWLVRCLSAAPARPERQDVAVAPGD